MLKKIVIIVVAFALCLALAACSGSNMSYTFSVETGEQIEVTLDTTGGYKFAQSGGDMYLSDSEGKLILTGYFLLPDAYESFALEPTLESGRSNDGDEYLYTSDDAGTVVFLARAKGASAGVLFYGEEIAGIGTCKAMFERLSFELR